MLKAEHVKFQKLFWKSPISYSVLTAMYLLIHQCFKSLIKQVFCVYFGVPKNKKSHKPNWYMC